MRTEQEVLMQLIQLANEDENIRSVVLNGSRVNPKAPKDFMRDYDVVYYMADLKNHPYNGSRQWISRFGDSVVVQYEDLEEGSSIYMMQFQDSVRIDLIFQDIHKMRDEVFKDSLSRILLDKDQTDMELPEPSDRTYLIKKPSRELWDLHIVELWWLPVYIAKELWRDEIPRVKDLYDHYYMESLRYLLEWHIGAANDWNVNTGSSGKWFKRFLERDLYEDYLSLYCGADPQEQWNKLFQAGDFVRRIGVPLAKKLGYDYPFEEDRKVNDYIEKVRLLPPDAQSLEG